MFHWQFLIIYIFSVSPNFRTCYIMVQWDEFTVKYAALCLQILSWHFFVLFFYQKKKKKCFHNFYFFFWWSNEFPKQNIKQSETAIGDKKLSVELYARKLVHACIANITYVTYLCSPRLAFKINWYWLLFIGGKAKHELRVQIYELRVQIYELWVPIHELQV